MTAIQFEDYIIKFIKGEINNYTDKIIDIIENNYYFNDIYKNKGLVITEVDRFHHNFLKHFNRSALYNDIYLYIKTDGELMRLTYSLQKKIYNKYKK